MGVVLFEMLTGRLPFESDTAIAAAIAQRSALAPDVRSLRPDVSAQVASVVAQALAARPSERPATASEMLAALPAAQTGARPVGPAIAARPTQVMPEALVRAAERGSPQSAAASHPSTGRTAILLFSAFLVVLGVVVGAAALGADGDPDVPSGGEAAVTSAAPQLVASVAPSSEATTTPPTTTTVPPTTTVPTTTVPPTTTTQPPTTTTQPPPTAPPIEEIIPGFPVTDDLAVFLAQVERDPDLVGPAGEELADKLERVLDDRGNSAKEAKDLRQSLGKWVDDDELAAPIADALDDLLRSISPSDDDDDDGDDD
jgi:hypothetical protein